MEHGIGGQIEFSSFSRGSWIQYNQWVTKKDKPEQWYVVTKQTSFIQPIDNVCKQPFLEHEQLRPIIS
jgi:hypothetical protein